ncbi:epoxide hydrolase family protein [Oceanicella sp. SM1341]|uniref:epoxide hydrolase family protein n=1 Tax=Oceanicella sp. SM1341 TaxID=1548889 RepID=UPI000E481382|nr:epoxide hydrolase [Oceanicella sp. SM1341]
MPDITPFTIAVPDAALADLRRRLAEARWPPASPAAAWEDGTDAAFLAGLAARWRDGYDWRAAEAQLNAVPGFMARLPGGTVHFQHAKGRGPRPFPLILTHGWPGSFVEAQRILPLLTDPGAHDADPEDAFDLVVPSLPGYGFSPAPAAPGCGPAAIAGLWHALMGALGYTRYGAQGGDWGASVSTWLARLHPGAVAGLHLNFIPGSFMPPPDAAPPTPQEQAFLARRDTWAGHEGAYEHIQATRPQTLAYALGDSPLGLAAWIAEKFRAWTDTAPGGPPLGAVPPDTLLTNISIYWFTGSIGSSMRLYREAAARPLHFAPGERVAPPLGVAVFPAELPMPPRSWVERVFDVARWSEMPRGGHFAALEAPEALAEEIRAFFRPLR